MWVEKHGPVWRIRDRRAGKVVTVESGYATKTAAKAAKVHLHAEVLRGDHLVPRGGQVLLSDWVAAWLPGYQASLKPSAAHSELGRIRNHILPLLGDLTLDEVDALTVQTWIAQLLTGERDPARPDRWARRPLAVKTTRNCHGVLHKILKAAVTQRLIRSNPCADTVLPKRVHKEMRFLTDPEIARLIAALPEHWRPLVLLLVATGLRWGEAVGLKVGRVDLLAKTPRLRVEEALHEKSGTAEIIFTSPKSEKSRRPVSFPKQVALALAPLVAGKERGEVVFTAPKGGYVRTRNFRRVWLTACKAAGLEGLRIHDLRHTHAAILISAGTPLPAVQRRLGHSSIVVTSDLYGHLREEVDEGMLADVEAALIGVDMAAVIGEAEEEMAEADL